MYFGNVLIISSHFDDAPLSLGGMINRREVFHDLQILVVFTRSSYTILPNITNTTDYISRLRDLEMESYCKLLGIELNKLGFGDTTQRKYPEVDIYKENIATFLNTKKPEEDDIFESVKFELTSKIRNTNFDSIFFPLGIGNHLDHLIVHKIARSISLKDKKIYYYEDLPYAADYEMEYLDWIANKRLNSPHNIYINITTELESKIMQLKLFPSQLAQKDFEFIKYHSLRLCKPNECSYERIWHE